MIRNITRPYYEVWGTEVAQNRFLKFLVILFVFITAVLSALVAVLALKAPTLIAVTPDSSSVFEVSKPSEDLLLSEIKRAVKRFVTLKHAWEAPTIEENMKKASFLVPPNLMKKFLDANATQVKIAKEKLLSQRFFIANIDVDIPAKSVEVSGERILIVQGLRAANPIKLRIEFELGPRSADNPEGIFISSEESIDPQSK